MLFIWWNKLKQVIATVGIFICALRAYEYSYVPCECTLLKHIIRVCCLLYVIVRASFVGSFRVLHGEINVLLSSPFAIIFLYPLISLITFLFLLLIYINVCVRLFMHVGLCVYMCTCVFECAYVCLSQEKVLLEVMCMYKCKSVFKYASKSRII